MRRFHAMRTATVLLVVLVAARAEESPPTTIANEAISIAFDSARAGRLVGIAHPNGDLPFLRPHANDDHHLWTIVLKTSQLGDVLLTPDMATTVTQETQPGRVTFQWRHVRDAESETDVTVTVTVETPPARAASRWRIHVEGDTTAVPWQVDFPRIAGVTDPGDMLLCVPHYLGRIVRGPQRHRYRRTLAYPEPASMQFLACWGTPDDREPPLPEADDGVLQSGWWPDRSDAHGLYWAAEDGDGHFKRFAVACAGADAGLAWHIEHVPGLDRWPPTGERQSVRYTLPYDVVVTTFRGGLTEAAAIYRRWATQQVWCRRGPAATWPDGPPDVTDPMAATWVPPWFRAIGFWAKFYHEPAKVLPEWAAYRNWLEVPMASHYYRYSIARFDDNYNEMLPADPYFLQGIRDAKAMGVRPLPYINGVIWDMDTPSWRRENGFRAAAKAMDGSPWTWDLHGEMHAYMCPATEQWRAKTREVADKLIAEHGCSGIYLDCLAATTVRPCFDPTHGHSLHGGTYTVAGNRRLLEDLRTATRQRVPDASFFTEEIGEPYIDLMDGFLTLDFIRSYTPPGECVFPVFSAVYHDYTINFGSDAQIDMPADAYALQVGTLFTWGMQPLHSAIIAKPPQAGDPNSELLREIVHAYYRAGRPFLMGGRWRALAIRPDEPGQGSAALTLTAPPCMVTYSKRRGAAVTWHGPAVLASAWDIEDHTGITMINITDQDRDVALRIAANRLGLKPPAVLEQRWPLGANAAPAAADGIHTFRIPARKVLVLDLHDEATSATPIVDLVPAGGWKLVTTIDGEMPSVSGPDDALQACADAVVRMEFTASGARAQPMRLERDGTLVPARGRQAAVRGPQAEGHGLPRGRDEQPFHLLRKLPHRWTAGETGRAEVFQGDSHALLARVVSPESTTLTLAGPGLTVVRSCRDDSLLSGLSMQQHVSVAANREVLVGYAAFDDLDALFARLERCAPGLAQSSDADMLRQLAQQPSRETLIAACRALENMACKVPDPAAFRDEAPMWILAARVRVLASAYTGCFPQPRSADDWLAPGMNTPLVTICPALAPRTRFRPVQERRFRIRRGQPAEPFRVVLAVNGPTVQDDIGMPPDAEPERLVPVWCGTQVGPIRIPSIALFELNRPFELRAPVASTPVVAGREASVELTARNWSPMEFQPLTITPRPAPGWDIAAPDEVTARALSDVSLDVVLRPSEAVRPGRHQLQVDVCLTAQPHTTQTATLTAQLIPSIVPMKPGRDLAPLTAPGLVRFRRSGQLVFLAAEGEPVELTIRNIRVTQYTDTLRYELLRPDLTVARRGHIEVDGEQHVTLPAAAAGAWFLRIEPATGSAEVISTTHALAEFADEAHALKLFCSPVTRRFWVPDSARQFAFRAQDGGPQETARVVITSPSGRIALDRDGAWRADQVFTIEVNDEEQGAAWTLACTPRQDIALWLEGDACTILNRSIPILGY